MSRSRPLVVAPLVIALLALTSCGEGEFDLVEDSLEYPGEDRSNEDGPVPDSAEGEAVAFIS